MSFVDEKGRKYQKIAENEKTFFLVPFKKLEDGGIEYDYQNIKAIDKIESDYPIEKIVDYSA